MRKMGKPEIGEVRRKDCNEKGTHVPDYIVRPKTFPVRVSNYSDSIKLVDFGESFVKDSPPMTLRTPLPVRAPEVIFGDVLTANVDLWSTACMVSTPEAPYLDMIYRFVGTDNMEVVRACRWPTALRYYHANEAHACRRNDWYGKRSTS
jgi:serine/threonine protein kinase